MKLAIRLAWYCLFLLVLEDLVNGFFFGSKAPSTPPPPQSIVARLPQAPKAKIPPIAANPSNPALSAISPFIEPNGRAVTPFPTPLKLTSSQTVGGKDNDKDLKLGVLFLNLGGPETMKDVEGFLYNLFADPDIIRLPPLLSVLQKPLAYFIAKRRAPKSSEAYQSIGGGSPIVRYTREQSQLVQQSLRDRGFDNANCYFAMRYWHPYTEEVLEQIRRDGVNTMVIVPLYPQFSISTSGSSLRLLQDIFYKQPEIWGGDKVAHTVVPAWYHRKGYVKAMAKLIVEQIGQYSPEETQDGIHVLYSAHGVPQSYIEAGDPYQKQIEECIKLISREVQKQLASDRLRPAEMTRQLGLQLAGFKKAEKVTGSAESPAVKFHLSFQSRVGPVKWLQPYTEEKLVDLGKDGVKNLVVVPVSFVSEHIETLEEIDMEYKELAHENGIANWKRVPALNTDPIFIEDLTDLVIEALESPTLTVAEAASKSYADMLDQNTLTTVSSNDRSANREQRKRKEEKDKDNDDDRADRGSKMPSSSTSSKESKENKDSSSRKVSRVQKVLSTLPFIGKRLFNKKQFVSQTQVTAGEELGLSNPEDEHPMKKIISRGLWGSIARKQEEKRQKDAAKKKTFALLSLISSTVYEFLTNLHVGVAHPIIQHMVGAK